jgi:hypothetical protein
MGKMKNKDIEEQNDQANGLRIWNKVSRTDPDHTKEVTFGRKFTAIDAHSQVMEATREFGPIGEGWGYENVYGEVHLQNGHVLVWCDVTFWWASPGSWEGNKITNRRSFGPIRGSAMLTPADLKKRPDADAYKKASTDGLTKCLSHLGFNADVFLGMFDDNKYVTALKKEKDAEASAAALEYAQTRAKFIEKIQDCKTVAECDVVLEEYKLWIDRLGGGKPVELRAWVEIQKAELK